MSDIILSTLVAKYIHPAFGLRYLLANLGLLKNRAILLEFDIKRKPAEVARAILDQNPKIVGLGIYIWNVIPLTQVVAELKREHPEITIVLGGPEVSFENDLPEICRMVDYVIAGEGEIAFAELCANLLCAGSPAPAMIMPAAKQVTSQLEGRAPSRPWACGRDGARPSTRTICASPVDADQLALPYDLYNEKDLAHRMTYVEASRGCPFECEYCISAGDAPVRYFDLSRLLPEFQKLLDRGAKHFKFVDRSFNIHIDFALRVLEFFMERTRPGLLLHFEMMPDRFPDNLRAAIRRFPPGVLHFEIGVQTFNDDVARRIKRHQKMDAIDDNLRFVRNETGSLVHADLIAGLPGETIESFAAGFDRLVSLHPHELQLGVLKRLRGAPIGRHDGEWGMGYSPEPPYEILENRLINRESMDRLKRFARYWEIIANRGNFKESLPLLVDRSPFSNFMKLGDWLFEKAGRDYGIALREMVELLFEYLTTELRQDARSAADVLQRDYQRTAKRETPKLIF